MEIKYKKYRLGSFGCVDFGDVKLAVDETSANYNMMITDTRNNQINILFQSFDKELGCYLQRVIETLDCQNKENKKLLKALNLACEQLEMAKDMLRANNLKDLAGMIDTSPDYYKMIGSKEEENKDE